MYGLVIFLHVLVCVILVVVVLFQQPQKGGMTSILGGSESIFGGGGAAPLMAKITSALAALFMITSISLVLLSARRAGMRPRAPVQTETQMPEETPQPEGGTQ
ncbi:MAG: preprotein translocase subunit SecG [candidate division WOR-3 bacterium]